MSHLTGLWGQRDSSKRWWKACCWERGAFVFGIIMFRLITLNLCGGAITGGSQSSRERRNWWAAGRSARGSSLHQPVNGISWSATWRGLTRPWGQICSWRISCFFSTQTSTSQTRIIPHSNSKLTMHLLNVASCFKIPFYAFSIKAKTPLKRVCVQGAWMAMPFPLRLLIGSCCNMTETR